MSRPLSASDRTASYPGAELPGQKLISLKAWFAKLTTGGFKNKKIAKLVSDYELWISDFDSELDVILGR